MINKKSLIILATLLLSACATPKPPPDYTLYQRMLPKTVLVLPPLNETAEINATNRFMSTISYSIAERGYYIFPVAIVDRILKENGAPSPVEMRQMSREKLKKLFGADALLDITIKEWGTKYAFLASVTKVHMDYSLIDLGTGSVLWSGSGVLVDDSNRGNNNGLAGMVVGALVHSVMQNASNPEDDLAVQANNNALMNDTYGLLKGPRFPTEEGANKQ